MKRIDECLNSKFKDLGSSASQLATIQTLFLQVLPEELKPHCRLGSFHKGCLTILVLNQAWGTKLRYCLPMLRDALRQGGLYQLSTLKIATETDITLPSPKKKILKLSLKAQEALTHLEQACDYAPLKNALRKLRKGG